MGAPTDKHTLNHWTEEEIQLLKENYAEYGPSRMREALKGRHPANSIAIKATQLGLTAVRTEAAPDRSSALRKEALRITTQGRIKQAMKDGGIKQAELARRLGITRSRVGQMLGHAKMMTQFNLMGICKALELDIDEVTTMSEEDCALTLLFALHGFQAIRWGGFYYIQKSGQPAKKVPVQDFYRAKLYLLALEYDLGIKG